MIFSRIPPSDQYSLVAYALWWTYIFYWFISGALANANSCGAANGGLVMLTLLIITVYSTTLLVLTLKNRGQIRVDYLVLLGLVLAPILYVLGYLLLTS